MEVAEHASDAVAAPAHLIGAARVERPAPPGTCGRCGSANWAALMQCLSVEYRLCRHCGRVWVERTVPEHRASCVPASVDGTPARLVAVLLSFVRRLRVQRA